MKKIIDVNHISTKKGDSGKSRNYSNELLDKTDILFDALGNIDELSSILGLTYHYTIYKDEIQYVQFKLQNISSLIATNQNSKNYVKIEKINQEDVSYLEELEDSILQTCDIEAKFVLPGSESTREGAYLDMARSITRRTERSMYKYQSSYNRDDLQEAFMFINRLSDLLFIMARSRDK